MSNNGADFYTSSAGSVAITNVQPSGFLKLDNAALMSGSVLLVTSVKLDRSEDIQALKTLSNNYYLYSFGEAPGRIMVGGLIFLTPCIKPGGESSSDTIKQLNDYYEKNRAYIRQKSMTVAIGTLVFDGVLTNLSISADPSPCNIAGFSMTFMLTAPAK